MFLLHRGSQEREYKEKSVTGDINIFILILFLLWFVGMLFWFFSICCWYLGKLKRKQRISILLLTNPTTAVSNDGFIVPSVLYNTAQIKEKELEKTDKIYPTLNIPTYPLFSPYDSTEIINQVWETNHHMEDMYLTRTFFNIIKI